MPEAFSIEISSEFPGDFTALEASAAVANPHALPSAMEAARAFSSDVRCLLARGPSREIIGCWPLAGRRLLPGLRVLSTPAVPLYDLSGSPLITASLASDGVEAMLRHLKNSEIPSRVLVLSNIQAEGPVWEALLAAKQSRLVSLEIIDHWERALFDRSAASSAADYFEKAMSSNSRKRLRAKRKVLEASGKLSFTIHSVSETMPDAFERFMAVEASGWKGASGTALRQTPADAAYVRNVLTGLSAHGRAFIAEMKLDERVIASGLLLRFGSELFFWKTAFDDSLAKHSPGVLFDLMMTEWLYSQDGFQRLDTGSDASVDPSTLIWNQRRPMASLVLSLDPGALSGKAVIAWLRMRKQLKWLKSRF